MCSRLDSDFWRFNSTSTGATTRIMKYIIRKLPEILLYSLKILHCSPRALKFSAVLLYALHSQCRISSEFNPTYVYARLDMFCVRRKTCAGSRNIILGKVNFRIPERTRNRMIRIVECIRDVRSSVRLEFSYDIQDHKVSSPTIEKELRINGTCW